MSWGRFHYAGLGQTTQDYLNIINQYEASAGNVYNYKYGTLTPSGLPQTAQGYYQITNQNWTKIAPQLGIDLTQYPTAITAPQDVQAQVATYLLTQTPAGISNWSNYNPQLNAALSAAGMQTSGTVTPSDGGASASGTQVADLTGDGAAAPTSDIMNSLDLSTASVTGGIDFTDPTTLAIVGFAALAAVLLLGKKVL